MILVCYDKAIVEVPMKPLLKWAGGKARLAEPIAEAFGGPCRGRYMEPFCGSGAVFLHLRSRDRVRGALLADVNGKLMAYHQAIRDDVGGVLAALGAFPVEPGWQERFYEIREAYNRGPFEGPEHAARFVWLNRAAFNGLYRENRSGIFNVPVGRYNHLALPAPEHVRAVSALLQGVELVTASFHEVMGQAGPGDHVYCDPPYVPLTATANFTGYSKEEFGPKQQADLAWAARAAAAAGARVVLSNHDLPVVRQELYPQAAGFEHVARPEVARSISRAGATRGKVAEVIARIGPQAA